MTKQNQAEIIKEPQRDFWKLLFKFVYYETHSSLKRSYRQHKQTQEMISLHKANHSSGLIINQYEAIKAKQISELIDGLTIPPYQTIESISVIKQILDKFYPDIPADIIKLKELKELEDAI